MKKLSWSEQNHDGSPKVPAHGTTMNQPRARVPTIRGVQTGGATGMNASASKTFVSIMRWFYVILIGVPLLNLLWWAWGHWKLGGVKHARWWRLGLAAFALLQLTQYALMISSRRMGIGGLTPPTPLLSLTYIWHLVVLPGFMVGLAAYYAVGLPWRGLYFALRRLVGPSLPAQQVDPDQASPLMHDRISRRELLKLGLVSAPAALTFIGTARALPALDNFRIRKIDVPLANLPPQLDGLTIAHITDVHAGKFTDEAVLRQMIRRTNELKPDLALLTGDLIDYSLTELPNALDAVKALEARYGVYMCEGNHDLFQDREGFEETVRSSDVPLLINEEVKLDIKAMPVSILGLRWERPGKDPAATFAGSLDAIPDNAGAGAHADHPFRILLAHHPQAFDVAAQRGIPLTLAGHTHGGQLMLNDEIGAGPMMFKYWSGLYRQDNTALVVGNGLGNWFPLRINAPAEIIHITLRVMS